MQTSIQRFWEDAKTKRAVFRGRDHEYIIDNGCKVEMYDDGSVRIYNTREGGSFYKEVFDLDRFLSIGFTAASAEMSIKTLKKQIEWLNDTRASTTLVKARIKELNKKIESYEKTFSDRQKNFKDEEGV
jgi:hypothetical protein